MQKYAVHKAELNWLQKGCYQLLLCLLLVAFSTSSYAASAGNFEKQLTDQQTSDSVLVADLSSSVFEIQAEEPEFDKAIDVSSRVFQSLLTLAPPAQRQSKPKLTQWNWHLVRGPPAHL
ncbi:hypothetical protein NJR55_05880 [Idiomarina sp. M1R2S28]|uniref:Uncharacterized protein n=1 Tax=Idiomarina rhizosphaerae TaxID=2961572 RepID=A0A9X2JST7_9GAMM|nr:hypothetical protein [Idiomarina rhizosphaerae]MCP1339120.1 hypothetical protein [Idiomarina rhizosphaerae]